MIKNRILILAFLFGIASSIAIVYFYLAQRNFIKEYREFSLTLENLRDIQNNINLDILDNSLYIYINQDDIAQDIKKLNRVMDKLFDSNILKRKNYTQIYTQIEDLKSNIRKNNDDIEDYLMFNAAIKNSILFLTRYINIATKLKNGDKYLYIKANKILKIFINTRKMKDLDYLHNKIYLLHSDSKYKETQKFIKNFNMHSRFLIKKYPPFIDLTNLILHNPIESKIQIIRKKFSNIAVGDFKEFDKFAFFMFFTFVLSFILIIIIFIQYLKSHKSLMKTTVSLEHSLKYDLLTNLRNRHSFTEDMEKLERPHILLININAFKNINDIYGNDIGNILLIEFGKLLQSMIKDKKVKMLYRLGGDDFAILFDSIDKIYALAIAREIYEKVAEYDFVIKTMSLSITVSISSNCTKPLLENADLALKYIKRYGRKNIIEYSDSLNLERDIRNNTKIIYRIKNAIKKDKIVPYFQPIIDIKTSKIIKYESLVRLIKEDGKALSPYFFLEISKKTPYYHEITRIMIEKTILIANKFPQYRFSINISMIDILDKGLTNMLFNIFDKNKETAKRVDIELLETENLEDMDAVSKFIDKLHSYGSQILIDDFGSGYSSFSYFSSIDVDIIKIDGSIIDGITTNKRKLHMTKSIHQFSKGMGLKNVAEFVETREAVLLLKEIGVEYAQGYYFSPPISMPLESDIVNI